MGYRCRVGSEPAGTWTHSLKQWAADTSHLALMMAAPQKCSLFSRRLTCQGNSPGDASTPPTILPAVFQPGCKPQSARQRSPTRTPRRQDCSYTPGTSVSSLSSPRSPRSDVKDLNQQTTGFWETTWNRFSLMASEGTDPADSLISAF